MSSATAQTLKFRTRAETRVDRFNAKLLNVTFAGPDGKRRSAIGGGESVAEAIAAARAELSAGTWTLARWSPLYGE